MPRFECNELCPMRDRVWFVIHEHDPASAAERLAREFQRECAEMLVKDGRGVVSRWLVERRGAAYVARELAGGM